MSKGTVQGKPGATHGTVKLEINNETDPNFSNAPAGTLLDFAPKYPFDENDVYSYVHDGDNIEFTITSYYSKDGGRTWTGSCDLIKKTQSKGIVRSASVDADAQGTLVVTVAIPSSGLATSADVTFKNNSGIVLKQNDYVEFDYQQVVYDQTGKKAFDATKKIIFVGKIKLIPAEQTPGSMYIVQAGDNFSKVVGTQLNFPLPSPVPSPFSLFNIAEVNIIDNGGSCEYVQLLDSSPEA